MICNEARHKRVEMLEFTSCTSNELTPFLFNPFMPNGISLSYQVDQSISVLRVVGWYF